MRVCCPLLVGTFALSWLVPCVARASYEWVEVPATTEGCATSIAVGADNIPVVAGCGGNPSAFWLNTFGSCGPGYIGYCNVWTSFGRNAKQVAVNLNGVPFLIDSSGNVYTAFWNNQKPGDAIGYGNIDAWNQLIPNSGGCITRLAPALESLPLVYNVNLNVAGPGTTDALYGIGCGAVDSYGDSSIWSWNLNLITTMPSQWQTSLSWEQLGPGQKAAAAQLALFNAPTSGFPSSQSLWVLNNDNAIFSYNNDVFTRMPQPSGIMMSITDHFVLTGYLGGAAPALWYWYDQEQTWIDIFEGYTQNGTGIVQIAASAAVNDTASGTVGPSTVWGIDNVGHIFQLVYDNVPPTQ